MKDNEKIKEFEQSCRKRAGELVSQMTGEEKLGLLSTHHEAIERLGIPEFFIGTEVARGYVGREPEKFSTVFPQPVGLASTFDRGLMKELGEIAGKEARAYYNKDKRSGLMLWGPTVDMVRDPRWGRTEEAYGEDVCLTGELSAAYTEGMAGVSETGERMIVPTLKHFCANNNEENRGSADAYLPPRLKYEYYYAAFENAIKYGGAKSVMAAYNEINGLPAIMNPELDTVLKEKWGLWFAVSDGGDFVQNVTAHRYCETLSEAYALCLKAGCDIMTDDSEAVRKAAKKALGSGLLTWEDIDRSITSVLAARIAVGNIGGSRFDDIGEEVIDCPEHREVNLRAAKEQIVLLKNDGLLPLKKAPKRIAVLGALADENLMDWYTGYWRGGVSVFEGIRKEFPEAEVVCDSIWEHVNLRAANGKYLSAHKDGTLAFDALFAGEAETFELQNWGDNNMNLFSVKYKKYAKMADDGTLKLNKRMVYDWFTRETFRFFRSGNGFTIEDFQLHKKMTADADGRIMFKAHCAAKRDSIFSLGTISSGMARAEQLAGESDLVVFCVGNHPVQVAKECYDRKTLELNIQSGMASILKNQNKNTVMVLISSYPYAIGGECRILPAVLYTSHAGAHLGEAVAMTLSGRNNPAGRLPLTWYRYDSDLPDILDYDIQTAKSTYMYFEGEPLFPFGYGLSYSRFAYGELHIKREGDGITATIPVTNVSNTDGEETVQLYFTVRDSGVSRPRSKLCGFERVFVPAGETVPVKLDVKADILMIYDVRAGKTILENGTYSFFAGASSRDIRACADLEITDGEELSERGAFFGADSFDECDNIRLCRSRRYSKDCARAQMFGGRLVYRGSRLGDGTVTARVSLLAGYDRLRFKAGAQTLEAVVPKTDSVDDISEVSVKFDNTDVTELEIYLPEGMTLFDIKLGE